MKRASLEGIVRASKEKRKDTGDLARNPPEIWKKFNIFVNMFEKPDFDDY